jgi:hypothetical protein
MFKNADKHSLYAWLDPVSGKCYIPLEMSPLGIVSIAIIIGLFAGAISRSYGLDRDSALLVFISVAVPIAACALLSVRKYRKVRAGLRISLRKEFPVTQ